MSLSEHSQKPTPRFESAGLAMLPPSGHREPCPGPMFEGPSTPIIRALICGEKRELWRPWVQTEIT